MNGITKTMVISLLLILFMPMAKLSAQVSTWDGTWEPWTHGTGTEADPFLIENAQQLAYLAYRVNNGLDAGGGHVSNHNLHYKLMVDVELNGSEDFQWTPVGYYVSSTDCQKFGGHFDGNRHVVLGMYINSSDYDVGFFGYTDGATIQNLSIRGILIATTTTTTVGFAGGIVGSAFSTKIIACDNTCNILCSSSVGLSSQNSCGGGIAGSVWGSVITNCYNTGSISTSGSCVCLSGGIIGKAFGGGTTNISNCYNVGSVSASSSIDESKSGGIVGMFDETATINNCFNAGNVYSPISSGYNYSGGIVGYNRGINNTITNSYNIGMISSSNPGGIIGMALLNEFNVTNCYYRISCGGNNNYGGEPTCSLMFDDTDMNNVYPIYTFKNNAETYNATDVGATSVTLHGSISIENTTVISKGFEYRKVGDEEFSIITIFDNLDYFSYYLDGLVENTYEYRTFLNVDSCDYTSYGKIKTFEVNLLNLDTICINNADMLRWVAEQCNSGTTFEGKCIKLTNDITLPLNVPNNMISIGSYPNRPFKGTFDGNGKLIYNLYIDQPNTPYQGFFGYTLNANLYNVGLVNITASGRNYTGGMVAYAQNTYIRDCYVNGGTLFALSYCGGLVGYQEQGTNSIISGCYNTCSVSGNHYVGGLIGFSNYSTVRNSYVAAPVSGQGNGIGAIIGGANEVLMYYCYFSTEITGQTNAIGENNFKDGEGMTNAQMRDPQFVSTLNQNLVTPVWMADYTTHINNGFPIINWQRPGTGVEEHDVVKSFVSLYPNPANGFVTIQSDEPSVSLKQVEVYDITGRKVMSETLDGQTKEFCIDKLLSGLYQVRVQTSNGCYTHLKLVVE